MSATSVIHFVPGLAPELGGISSTVPRLISALSAAQRFRVRLVSFAREDIGDRAGAGNVETGFLRWPAWHTVERILRPSAADTILNDAALVHIHGLWTPLTALILWRARKRGIPYVVSAHGMLDRWALNHKHARKKLYSAVAERRNLLGAACLHALTRTEAEDYRRFGVQAPTVVIPNGVDTPSKVDARVFTGRFPQLLGKRVVLFLGRIHPKKGLDLLLEAWGGLHARHSDAHLVIAGPDAGQILPHLQEMVKQNSLGASVTFAGMLTGDVKWSALAHAHVFVLPSRSEGFSAAVLEALSCGTPVAITHPCNFPAVSQSGAGWVTDPEAQNIQTVLDTALRLAPDEHVQMRLAAVALAKSFSWSVIGGQFAGFYDWILGGPRPDCEIL